MTGVKVELGKDRGTGSWLRIHISLLIRMLVVAWVRQLLTQATEEAVHRLARDTLDCVGKNRFAGDDGALTSFRKLLHR